MQVLTNLLMIFKSIAVAVGRLLYLLLIKLFLIIPVLYVTGIAIASACVPFVLGDYSALLIVGTVLCTVLSALLVLRRAMLAPITKRNERHSNVIAEEEMETGKPARAEEPAPLPEPIEETRPVPERKPRVEERHAPAEPEPPKYYRTRRDPNLFIADFPDRMEFYRKMPDGGYVFLTSEPKKSETPT